VDLQTSHIPAAETLLSPKSKLSTSATISPSAQVATTSAQVATTSAQVATTSAQASPTPAQATSAPKYQYPKPKTPRPEVTSVQPAPTSAQTSSSQEIAPPPVAVKNQAAKKITTAPAADVITVHPANIAYLAHIPTVVEEDQPAPLYQLPKAKISVTTESPKYQYPKPKTSTPSTPTSPPSDTQDENPAPFYQLPKNKVTVTTPTPAAPETQEENPAPFYQLPKNKTTTIQPAKTAVIPSPAKSFTRESTNAAAKLFSGPSKVPTPGAISPKILGSTSSPKIVVKKGIPPHRAKTGIHNCSSCRVCISLDSLYDDIAAIRVVVLILKQGGTIPFDYKPHLLTLQELPTPPHRAISEVQDDYVVEHSPATCPICAFLDNMYIGVAHLRIDLASLERGFQEFRVKWDLPVKASTGKKK